MLAPVVLSTIQADVHSAQKLQFEDKHVDCNSSLSWRDLFALECLEYLGGSAWVTLLAHDCEQSHQHQGAQHQPLPG